MRRIVILALLAAASLSAGKLMISWRATTGETTYTSATLPTSPSPPTGSWLTCTDCGRNLTCSTTGADAFGAQAYWTGSAWNCNWGAFLDTDDENRDVIEAWCELIRIGRGLPPLDDTWECAVRLMLGRTINQGRRAVCQNDPSDPDCPSLDSPDFAAPDTAESNISSRDEPE